MDYSAFQDDPRYQRMIQKIMRIPPEQRAILSASAADETFGDIYARNSLNKMLMEADKQYQDKSLDLRTRSLNTRMGLERETFGEQQRQDKLSTGIGLGQVAAETYFGGQRDELDRALLRRKMGLLDMLEKRYGGV